MKSAVVYIHGKGGTADEAGHYKPLFPDRDVIGFDYKSDTPRQAKSEFLAFFDEIFLKYASVSIIANSIGAFFAMHALNDKPIEKAYFISPIVDMVKLISDMLKAVNATEKDLQREEKIETPFGETLSWSYLCYVKEHPVRWIVPTHIFYGENDSLTSFEAISAFASATGATLDIMAGGEHWFHTKEQMMFLDQKILQVNNVR